MLADYVELHKERTPKSAALYERACRVMPGGICHNPRYYKPYPIYMDKAYGSKIRDVDGNEYVDVWMGHYSLILGHNPELTQGLLQEAVGAGPHWGIPHEYQVAYAEDLCRVIPCMEQLRFCVTGTEATMYAVRLARAFTGRDVVLKTRGGWHGGNTDLSVAVHAPMDEAESAGLPSGVRELTQSIPYNDIEGTISVIKRFRDRLAAVIIEAPIQSFTEPVPGYLETVRDELKRAGALVILDEVISGGRLGLRGAQGYYGITPDLATMGKVLGGGMPLGIVGGREDIMALSSPTSGLPKSKSVLVGGGTFSTMPPAMRAGRAVFRYLEENQETLYPELARKGEVVRKGIRRAFAKAGVPVTVFGVGSLFSVQFPPDQSTEIRNIEDIETRTNMNRRNNEFKVRMLNHGVNTVWGGGALSLAHADQDLDTIVSAAAAVAGEMAEDDYAGRIPGASTRGSGDHE